MAPEEPFSILVIPRRILTTSTVRILVIKFQCQRPTDSSSECAGSCGQKVLLWTLVSSTSVKIFKLLLANSGFGDPAFQESSFSPLFKMRSKRKLPFSGVFCDIGGSVSCTCVLPLPLQPELEPLLLSVVFCCWCVLNN